jgi:TfoX/Sxy family transcriptional regulator of competence genes
MAYDEKLAERMRESLAHLSPIVEKEMIGGLSFLYKGKTLVGIIKDEMMCRIDPASHDAAVEQPGCRIMDFTGRPMKGWVMVDASGMKTKKQMDAWIALALEYNSKAKSSKKKKQ